MGLVLFGLATNTWGGGGDNILYLYRCHVQSLVDIYIRVKQHIEFV